jgi:hypothetical protein
VDIVRHSVPDNVHQLVVLPIDHPNGSAKAMKVKEHVSVDINKKQ